jgi:glycosyltransferase involved in cell wall biosynthesis
MPQISIIVPVFNCEASLTRCLDSLIQQTFPDIEIICIDDGSTDATPKVLQRFAENDNRITVITQTNAGPAAARNRGLDRIKSPYVMFCDSDDYYDLQCCEKMIATIRQQDVDVVMCRTQVHLESASQRAFKISYFNPHLQGRYTLNDEIASGCNTVIWNRIWKQELIQRAQIRFPEGHDHDDDAFWFMYALEAKTIYFLPECGYHHWIRSGSIMDRTAKRLPRNKYDRLMVAKYVHAFAEKQGYAQCYRRRITHYYRAECEGLQLELFSEDERKQLVADLNTARPGEDRLFFFGRRVLTCVLKKDMEAWVYLRLVVACCGAWVTLGITRRAMRRERRYFRDVLRAKGIER